MNEHYNTGPGLPQTQTEVVTATDEVLDDLMGRCPVEPADPQACLACFAYMVMQRREAERRNEVPGLRFFVDGNEVAVGNDVRAEYAVPFDGYSTIEFKLTSEGFIADAFNEDGECYKTQAFTYEEWAEVGT